MNTEIAVDVFSKKINAIDNLDYGDFMRRANLYLMDLDDQITKTNEIRNLMKQMKDEIQYNPSWDIQSTRERISHLTQAISQIQVRPASQAELKQN